MVKKFFIIVAVVFGISSCNNQLAELQDTIGGVLPYRTIGLTEPEILSIMYGSDNELTEEEGEQILKDFIFEQSESRASSSITLRDKEVIGEFPIASRSDLNLAADHVTFYEYELDSPDCKTTAIVCGDKRFPSVIAYIDSYSIENEPASIMIGNAKQYAMANISHVIQCKDSLRNKTLSKIYGQNNIPESFDFSDIENQIFLLDNQTKGWKEEPGGSFVAKIGPLTSTTWNQNPPYNLYAPTTIGTNDYFVGYDDRYPSGCVVVAMAQIAAYLKAPLPGVNWNIANVPNLDSNDDSAVMAVATIMKMIADGSETTYGHNGGSTNTDKARDYMKKYGVYMDNATSCMYQNMKSSLDDLRIVYITGTARRVTSNRGFNSSGSHAWLVDGYQVRERDSNSRMILKQYNVYCHCNFGWGGNSDGWYLFQSDGSISFSCNGSIWDYDLFDYNLKIYPNVRKG